MEELTKENTESRIANWLKCGEAFIFPERLEEWKDCVEARAQGIYNGKDLDISLDIMEKLNNGAELSDVKTLLEEKTQSAGSYTMVSQIVFAFSSQGPEFLEYIMNGNISPETKKAIENKRRENLKLIQTSSLDVNKQNVSEMSQKEQNPEQIFENSESVTQDNENDEETLDNSNNYLQIKKDNIFTKIVTFIRKLFMSKKYKNDTSIDTKDI